MVFTALNLLVNPFEQILIYGRDEAGFVFQVQASYNYVALLHKPMVKLPCSVNAGCAAGLSDLFVRFSFLFLLVQFHLHGAFHLIAEFSALIRGKTFKRHFHQGLISIQG